MAGQEVVVMRWLDGKGAPRNTKEYKKRCKRTLPPGSRGIIDQEVHFIDKKPAERLFVIRFEGTENPDTGNDKWFLRESEFEVIE